MSTAGESLTQRASEQSGRKCGQADHYGMSHVRNTGRRLSGAVTLAGWLVVASAMLAAFPAAAQRDMSPARLPNGAVNNRVFQPEYRYHRHSWGYNYYFGSENQGSYDDGELHAWNVQGDVWLIVGQPNQANTVVQIGNEGALVVDPGTTEMAPKLLELINRLIAQYSGDYPHIRWVINTNADPDHIGGNEVIRAGGKQITGLLLGPDDVPGATVVSSQGTLAKLIASGTPDALWPTEAHDLPVYSWYFNDEAVVLHQPRKANTKGTLAVQFRRADVIAVGDLVTYNSYPHIDIENGGTIDGLLTALYDVMDLTTAGYHNGEAEGGTMIIPGHGRMIDRAELLHYIYSIQLLRNRISYHKNRGRTLKEVLDMKPTSDSDGRWGNGGIASPDDFVTAVYRTLPTLRNGPDRFFIPDSN